MQEKEIGHRANRQHVVATRNALDKGVLRIKRHNIAFAQTLCGGRFKGELIHRLDLQIEREVEIQLF